MKKQTKRRLARPATKPTETDIDITGQGDDTTVDSVPTVAKRWGCSDDTLWREVTRGNLKVTRLGPRRVGIRRSEQRRYLDKRTG